MNRLFRVMNFSRPMSSIARVTKIPKEELYISKPIWWLESRFHFSFAEYCHPRKNGFGALFVLNDDLVQPHAGFGRHPHRNAEIFSYVLEGELSHQDSMGNKEALDRGAIQYLSAGSGITHSEMNDGDHVCRFLQIWIKPNKHGVTPQYGSQRHPKEDRHNQWLHLLGGTGSVPKWDKMSPISQIRLHQDCSILVTETDPNLSHDVTLLAGRRMYMVCMEGSLVLNNEIELSARDAIEIVSPEQDKKLQLTAHDDGMHVMAIELAV